MRSNLGAQLKELRESKGYTRLEIAERMGLPEASICRFEDGLGTATETVAFLCSIGSPQAVNLASALALEWAIFPDTQFVEPKVPYSPAQSRSSSDFYYPYPWVIN